MNFLDRLVNIVDQGTRLPGKVAEKSDQVNDYLINLGTSLSSTADEMAARAKGNLTENKVSSLGRDAAQWIQKGQNLWLAVAAVVGVIFLIRRI